MATRILLSILTVLALHGCGQMGPLYLPSEAPVEAPVEIPAETSVETDQGSPEAKDSDA